ncbi:MAG: methyl-accepting chemotaxis protein [Kineosporiaceae bacterium]
MSLGLLPSSRRRAVVQADLAAMLADADNPLTAVLASLHGNCFIADNDLRLIWMNDGARETMAKVSGDVHKAFGVSMHDMLGESIHRFHKDPRRIDALLADPASLPRTARFAFGKVTLDTKINAIVDGAGRRLGFVVLWQNVSSQVADYQHFSDTMERLSMATAEIAGGIGDSRDQADAASSATQELRSAVSEIARSSSEATQRVREAVDATHLGVERLRDLQRSSNEIGDFLRLITGVAEQTKMLALNATIAAARAGAAGKGFAVVADEVKQLAGTTSASISDIESRIEAIQTAAQAGVAALAEIEALVSRISESQETVAAAIEEQSAVTSELAAAIASIADGTRDTSDRTMVIAESVDDVLSRASALLGQTGASQ